MHSRRQRALVAAPAADLARAANARSDFNIGFCGYRFNGDIGAYTVRFRHYDPTPGMCRWLERDPAGYQDGPSLYSYLGRNPMAGTDPYGLASDDAHWHHLLPQELKDLIGRFFGDDFLNSAENGLILPKDVHQQLHGKQEDYNSYVKNLLEKMRRKGQLQDVNPSWKNAKQLQEINRTKLRQIRASIMAKFGSKLKQGVRTLVTYSQWKKRGLSKGFFANMKALGKKAAFNGTRLPAAFVFLFISSTLNDSIAEAHVQAMPEYHRLLAYYEHGEFEPIEALSKEIGMKIRLMGNEYEGYAEQFEETWRNLADPRVGSCP
jgi:RHS repeat-associated protein